MVRHSLIPSFKQRGRYLIHPAAGTAGIGAEIVEELSKHAPGHIIFTGRNAKSAEAVTKRVQKAAPTAAITFIACDLASLASVKAAADKILAEFSRLDVFMANAGIMSKPAALSTDGYEIQFATNHLGHALLTQKLLPLLERTADLPGADVRVVYTSSTGFRAGQLHFDRLKTTMDGPMGRGLRYSNSKLANILYAREVAKRHPKLLAFSVTPGVVGTSLVSDLTLTDRIIVYASQLGRIRTPEQGSFNHLVSISQSTTPESSPPANLPPSGQSVPLATP